MHFVIRVAAVLGFSVVASLANAQKYPSQIVTLIVPYPPGGATDAVARALARALSRHWDQTVMVENVSGADGLIGTQKMLRAKPDGYMLLMPASQSLLWKFTNPKANVDLGFCHHRDGPSHSPAVSGVPPMKCDLQIIHMHDLQIIHKHGGEPTNPSGNKPTAPGSTR